MPLTKATYSMIEGASFNVLDFGATGDGATNDRAACQAAIDAARAAGGGVVYFPPGTYLLTGVAGGDSTNNGLLVPYSSANDATDRVLLVGSGASTILKADSNSMYIVRYSDSHGGVESMTLDANGKTGVIGLGVVPEDTTQTSTLVFQNYNVFRNLYIAGCAEGVTLRCGPDVSGADSGCWYNEFYSLKIYSCTRGIWLQNGPNASTSGVNRNKFFGGRVGQSGTNTGLQIDSGDTNEFHDVSFEGIQSGTSPNTTPTAVKIAVSGTYSGDNNSNKFFGGTCEANSRDLENANSYTEMYGFYAVTNNLLTANPLVMFGGFDSSSVPQIYPSQLYQSNSQIAGYENNLNYFLSSRGFKTNGIWMTRKTEGTGPGGSNTDFDFEFGYQAGAVYLVSRGGYDSAGTVYGHRVSVFFETSSGTFVEGTKIVDSVSASTSFATDTVTRSTAFVRVTVNVNKTATTFTNYATVIRLA